MKSEDTERKPGGRAGAAGRKAYFHLPGLFEFQELYTVFLRLFREHREYFYDWCEIFSVYGAPAGCLWDGGRVGAGDARAEEVTALMWEYGISPCLTFSNSLLREEHLKDPRCNALCALIEKNDAVPGGVILCSDLLLEKLRKEHPKLYFVSSTTKVLDTMEALEGELGREEFRYVVPDFRLNKRLEQLDALRGEQKEKVEFLCNECCWVGCRERKACYENVSRRNLGEDCGEHVCASPTAGRGYRFSDAMKNPGFISKEEIREVYLPRGFSHFKIEGRGLGSAVVLEMLLYYLVRPEWQITVREEIYLDSMLDLF